MKASNILSISLLDEIIIKPFSFYESVGHISQDFKEINRIEYNSKMEIFKNIFFTYFEKNKLSELAGDCIRVCDYHYQARTYALPRSDDSTHRYVNSLINKLEDDWYVISYHASRQNNSEKYYLCDGFDGLL